MTHWQGKFDMHLIDTKPGGHGPFAPPDDWSGDADAYRELMRGRYRADIAARQQMAIVAMRPELATFTGPWAVQAGEIVAAIGKRNKEGRAA